MANRKRKDPQVVIYKTYLTMFLALGREQNGEILEAIAKHVLLGDDIQVSEVLRPMVSKLLADIDENMTYYEARCEKNKQIADEREQKKAEENNERDTNVTRTCNERDTNVQPSNSNSNSNSNSLSEDKESKRGKSSRFIPPTLEEVEEYARSINHHEIDCGHFLDHYTANEWKQSNGNKIKDWKATFRNWIRNEPRFKTSPITKPQTMAQEIQSKLAALDGVDFMGGAK